MGGSIRFDRAAEYYDRTRRLPPRAHAAVIDFLTGELRGRGRCLEIGVGTGRMALDLHRAGVAMAGVDLSRAMLAQLLAKNGGSAPFPMAVADATALPCRDGAFGAALACHVLHLVTPWRRAVEELLRAVRPGGVILCDLGGGPGGAARRVRQHFFERTRLGSARRRGLEDPVELDELMRRHGAAVRLAPPIVDRTEATLGGLIDRLEAGIFALCWSLSDEERRSAAAVTRDWARRQYGPLDAKREVEAVIRWRAYDLPA